MESIDLAGIWTLRRLADGSRRPMAVPGDILSALIASGEAPDPYYARNELGLQWVGREDWEIEREIELPASLFDRERVILEAEVLDTVAEVRINGGLLGTSRNMFRRFRADAKALLRPGRNLVSVTIRSPVAAALAAAALLPYPVPASTFALSSPHRNLLRKAQCMSGWDWGPCLMTGGVYDGIGLRALDGPAIEYVTTRAERGMEPGSWKLALRFDLDAARACRVRLEAEVAGCAASREVVLPAGASTAELCLEVAGVEDWWPAGYGAQPLYGLAARCVPAGPGAAGDSVSKRVGFRELKLVSEPDAEGRSFVVRVNGREVFCKGANWIPADALPSRWTKSRIASLLGSAAWANMNCIRVWGGGRYESEDFYELCDELGLLVWQDCMFSCATYPSDPDFLAEVRAEVRHQALRLKDHPSLALWCGNNEVLGALGWYEETKAEAARYLVGYDRLNEGAVGDTLRELDPGRAFWPSSPSGGPGDYGDNWHGDSRGDMHFWSVWHEGKSFSEYLAARPRFCSEFGFQSYPSERAVASFAPEGERNVTGPVMEHHQRHPRGNAIILETMARYFRMPSGFRETLYLSQVQQALAIRTAVAYWRGLRPRCMGILYWQLNDVWPASSWSSLDHGGEPKLLHYEARRFFDPLYLSLCLKDGLAEARLVNDGPGAVQCRLTLRLRRFDGSTAWKLDLPAAAGPGEAAALWRSRVADLPAAPDEAFLEARLEVRAPGDAGSSGGRAATLFLTEPKRCSLADPALAWGVADGPGGPALRVAAGAPAFFVSPWLRSLPGRFEDSGFDLGPGEARELAYVPSPGLPAPSAAGLAADLELMHLRASYE